MISGFGPGALAILLPLVFLSGLVDAIAGGGGLISLPAYLLAGVPAHFAVATNKISSSMGLVVSTARYVRRGNADWALAIPSAALSVLGAMLGARLNLLVPERVIRILLVALLPVAAFIVLRKRELSPASEIPRTRQFAAVCLLSALIGAYDGFYGPGAGTFLLLGFTGLAGLSVQTSSANMKIANICSNSGALVVYLLSGQALIPLGLVAGIAAVLGQYVGSGFVIRKGVTAVRPVILIVLTLLFLRVVLELTGIL